MSATDAISLLRLSPLLDLAALPSNPSLPASDAASASPASLALQLLSQAYTFSNTTLNGLTVKKGLKKSSGSAASVQVLHGSVGNDYWVGRRSRHGGKREAGDADWDEFEQGLRVDHSKHEMEYTPGVKDCVEICKWDVGSIEGWEKVELAVFEMLHQLPTPLKPRVFTVLIASGIPTTATAGRRREFVTASVPLAPLTKDAKTAKYGTSSAVVHGAYVSVEHVYEEEEEEVEGGNGEIVWDMATASNAKGALPMAVQKLGIAGAIVKDVGLFLDWAQKQRGKA